jgi:hypothetical protein
VVGQAFRPDARLEESGCLARPTVERKGRKGVHDVGEKVAAGGAAGAGHPGHGPGPALPADGAGARRPPPGGRPAPGHAGRAARDDGPRALPADAAGARRPTASGRPAGRGVCGGRHRGRGRSPRLLLPGPLHLRAPAGQEDAAGPVTSPGDSSRAAGGRGGISRGLSYSGPPRTLTG